MQTFAELRAAHTGIYFQVVAIHKKRFLFQLYQSGATSNQRQAPALIQMEHSWTRTYYSAQYSMT